MKKYLTVEIIFTLLLFFSGVLLFFFYAKSGISLPSIPPIQKGKHLIVDRSGKPIYIKELDEKIYLK
jgi:hypothetical protein